jgi:hypothetical protein
MQGAMVNGVADLSLRGCTMRAMKMIVCILHGTAARNQSRYSRTDIALLRAGQVEDRPWKNHALRLEQIRIISSPSRIFLGRAGLPSFLELLPSGVYLQNPRILL